MKNFKKIYFATILLICTLAACLDEVNLSDPDQPDSAILVQGRLIQGNPSQVEIGIFELYTLSNNIPRSIEAKSVVLKDDTGRSKSIPTQGHGQYLTKINPNDADFPIEIGRQYRLEIEFFDGRNFVSEWEKLLATPKIDALDFEFFGKDGYDLQGNLIKIPFVRFNLSTDLTAAADTAPVRLRWEFDSHYKLTDNPEKTCYITRRLLDADVSILNTEQSKTLLKNHPAIETQLDYRFGEGFYLTAYQQVISENAYGYFEELNQLLAKKGTLFDPPAGAIRTNISSPSHPEVLTNGFFYVTRQDTLRRYFSPAMMGNPKKRCPLPPINGEAPRPNSCDDCFLESPSTATLNKPIWWQ